MCDLVVTRQCHVELSGVDWLDIAPEDPSQNPADQALQNRDGSNKSRQKTKQNTILWRTNRPFIYSWAVDLKRQN